MPDYICPACMTPLGKVPEKDLTICQSWARDYFPTADVAQLAEHLVVAQGVKGSSPFIRPIIPIVEVPRRRGLFLFVTSALFPS